MKPYWEFKRENAPLAIEESLAEWLQRQSTKRWELICYSDLGYIFRRPIEDKYPVELDESRLEIPMDR